MREQVQERIAGEGPLTTLPRDAEPGPEGDDLNLVVPERGTADELLDATAGEPLDPMRHSAAHVMAEAVLDLMKDVA